VPAGLAVAITHSGRLAGDLESHLAAETAAGVGVCSAHDRLSR
jgi:hypothetical protein